MKTRMKTLEKHKRDDQTRAALKQCKLDLDELLHREEILWRQRSRVSWLKDGDRNTSFFHTTATIRRQKNTIKGIYNSDDQWMQDISQIKGVASKYFKEIFQTTRPQGIEKVTRKLEKRVDDNMNTELTKEVTTDEILRALHQIHPTKAPGPDGNIHAEWNSTNIVLIPKVQNPGRMMEYRPIALCNVAYKIIAKLLANRLKRVLPSVITFEQSAFVPGRLITDNVMVAFECMHYLKTRRSGKKGFMALKLDMSKAYDRIEWRYLEEVMLALGFSRKWIMWIMSCVSSVSYRVRINGECTEPILPSRGLRQGDPLSPYLFLLCTEGLSALIKNANSQGRLQGIAVARGSPRISHLLFADDSILFCRATVGDSLTTMKILQDYEKASGQQINISKSAVFFSRNVPQPHQFTLMHVLGINKLLCNDKYLGLPMFIGKSKKMCFDGIKERVWKKLQGWKQNCLSMAGREVLIKAVVQALPTYSMSCFRLPISLVKDIQKMISKFWWGQSNEQRKVHWLKWEKLCDSKSEGGLGFRDLECFNQAMLAKQGWRLIQNPNSLATKVLKAKYYPKSQFMEAGVPQSASNIWRSIASVRTMLKDGLCWRVGDGKCINVWKDRWIPSIQDGNVLRSPPGDDGMKVEHLIDQQHQVWKSDLIQNLFPCNIADQICLIPLCPTSQPDQIMWRHTTTGEYSVRSGYYTARKLKRMQVHNPQQDPWPFWNRIWSVQATPRILYTVWKACHDILPTKGKLLTRGIDTTDSCTFCSTIGETCLHILRECPWTIDFWRHLPIGNLILQGQVSTPRELAEWACTKLQQEDFGFFCLCIWVIWNARNRRLHEGQEEEPAVAAAYARRYYDDMLSAFVRGASNSPRNLLEAGMDCNRWKAPETGTCKINCDAAVSQHRGRAGAGIVIRNSSGRFIGGGAFRLPFCTSVPFLEAAALWKGLILAKKLGVRRIVLESDSEVVIKQIQSHSHDLSNYGHMLQSVGALVSEFEICILNHVRRHCNEAAHTAARFYADHGVDVEWISNPPLFLETILCNEFPAYE